MHIQSNICLRNYQYFTYDVGMVKSPLAKQSSRAKPESANNDSLSMTTPCAGLRDEAYRQTSARAREPGHSSQPHPTINGPFRQKERRTFPLPSHFAHQQQQPYFCSRPPTPFLLLAVPKNALEHHGCGSWVEDPVSVYRPVAYHYG